MKVIGLTGGIGSGKSTVAHIFEQLDIPVYNSDARAKLLMEESQEIKNELQKEFGDQIYNPDGLLDRKNLASIIFKHQDALDFVNKLVHPKVAIDFLEWKSVQKTTFVIKETALLIETMKPGEIDKIIVVLASKPIRLHRIKSRDGLNEAEILNRMDKQLDDQQRILFADYIIYNEQNKSLIQQTLEIFFQLKKLT